MPIQGIRTKMLGNASNRTKGERLLKISLFLLLCSTIALAFQKNSTSSPAANFQRLADQFMKEGLVLSPVNASQAGYHKHTVKGKTIELDAELDDVSAAGVARQKQFLEK